MDNAPNTWHFYGLIGVTLPSPFIRNLGHCVLKITEPESVIGFIMNTQSIWTVRMITWLAFNKTWQHMQLNCVLAVENGLFSSMQHYGFSE